MANRFIEGFDYLTTALLAKRFQVDTATVGANGRNGGNSCRCSQGSGLTWGTVRMTGFTIGYAHKQITSFGASGVSRQWRWMEDSLNIVHLSAGITAAGNIIIYRGSFSTLLATGTTTLVADQYYYIEYQFTISDTTGVVKVWINGVAETLTFVTGTETTQDTRNAGNGYVNFIGIGNTSGSSTASYEIDDLYLNDDTGGVDDSTWGDVRVIAVLPDSAGNYAQFTPSTGSNYQNVDDATADDDTTYNSSATVNHIDSFGTASLGVTGTVKGVSAQVYAKKTDSGTCSLAPFWRISGTDYAGTGIPLGTVYGFVTQLYRVSPATSSAWSTAEINGAEMGYKRTA